MKFIFSRLFIIARNSFIIFLGIFSSSAYGECNFKTSNYLKELSDINSIKHIEVRHKEYNKWATNSLKIISSSDINIASDYKKKYWATITAHYNFGICRYKSRVRQHGDERDHIKFVNGKLAQSLDVRLKEGNIANMVKFKLLLKETRNSDNEIFGTLLLSKLGFLAPRTKNIKVNQNGLDLEMILQEKVSKEFLENNDRREGPIFTGDESILFEPEKNFELMKLEHIALSKMINEKWAQKGKDFATISLDAFEKLQIAYINYADQIRDGKHSRFRFSNISINLPFNSSIFSKRFNEYEILLIAMNGTHGLRPHNRIYYWNIFFKKFEPIYYDGDLWPHESLKDGFINYGDAAILLAQINKVDIDKIFQDIKFVIDENFILTFSNLSGKSKDYSFNYTFEAKEKILSNLLKIESMLQEISTQGEALIPKDELEKKINRFINRYTSYKPDAFFVSKSKKLSGNETVSIKCYKNTKCNYNSLNFEQVADLLDKNKINGKTSIFLPNVKNNNEKIKDFNETVSGNISVKHSLTAKVNYDPLNKILYLMQDKPEDWFLISDQKISDIIIKFVGKNEKNLINKKKERINKFGFTGCLNIFNSELYEVEFFLSMGFCEDSLNIVSSKGNIKKIEVTDAFSDAIDLDFSDLIVGDLIVSKAENDCLDVSSGNYKIEKSVFSYCGDKGISVGEKSNAVLNKVKINFSNIGIASKDSSITTLNKAHLKNIKTCISAYNKKPEFLGGLLKIKSIKCENYYLKADVDDYSEINIESEF